MNGSLSQGLGSEEGNAGYQQEEVVEKDRVKFNRDLGNDPRGIMRLNSDLDYLTGHCERNCQSNLDKDGPECSCLHSPESSSMKPKKCVLFRSAVIGGTDEVIDESGRKRSSEKPLENKNGICKDVDFQHNLEKNGSETVDNYSSTNGYVFEQNGCGPTGFTDFVQNPGGSDGRNGESSETGATDEIISSVYNVNVPTDQDKTREQDSASPNANVGSLKTGAEDDINRLVENLQSQTRNVQDYDEEEKTEVDEKVLDSSPTGRFVKLNVEIGRGSFKTVYKGRDRETGATGWCDDFLHLFKTGLSSFSGCF